MVATHDPRPCFVDGLRDHRGAVPGDADRRNPTDRGDRTLNIIDGMKDTDYHARPELGSTSVKTLAKHPPAVYRWQADNPQPHKAVFDIGTAAHSLILEGTDEAFTVLDFDDYRSKAAREARDEVYAAGKVPLLWDQRHELDCMSDAVLAHPIAGPLLTGHIAERSFFTELHGVPVKARPDALNGTTVVDLKTTGADLNDLARTVNNFGYYIQQAHYTAVLEACGQTVDDFVFIFVSTQAPHMVRVVRLEETAVDLGQEHMTTALLTYKECSERNHWPGYEQIDTLDLPAWVYHQDDNDLEEFTFSHGS